MDTVALSLPTRWTQVVRRVERPQLATWALVLALVLYLGFEGGGYDIVVSSQIGLIVWWTLLIGAAAGLLPGRRLPRLSWVTVGCLTGFVAWTALAITWSISSSDSFQELTRDSLYLGVLLLGLALHRERGRAVRDTTAAVGAAVAVVAVFGVLSRVLPGAFPSAHVTAAFLPGAQQRLSWPLNYWNGLAALMALGLPALLYTATSARTIACQAIAAAAVPVVALCAYLTFSRGGAVALGAGVVVFFALAADRLPKLLSGLAGAAGSAIVILAVLHRSAIDQGLTGPLAHRQGREVLPVLVLVVLGTGLFQAAIAIALRHATRPRILRIPLSRARLLLAAGAVVTVAVVLVVRVPGHLEHLWHDFKLNNGTASGSALPQRYGSLSGEGRYSYWRVALQATAHERLKGSGPGTFELLWLPHATFFSPSLNAHSLYVETLATTGIVGLVLLGGFLVVLLLAAVRLVVASRDETRVAAAAATAAIVAFLVAATVDWDWQLPVLPVIFMLLAAAILAPRIRRRTVREQLLGSASSTDSPTGGRRPRPLDRLALALLAAASLVGIAIPLASVTDVRRSQAAATAGNTALALEDARSAVRVEPGAASAELQLALVLELRHDLPAALSAARQAAQDEPLNWQEWLILSRLEAESGRTQAALVDFRHARSLNPMSPLFQPSS